MPDHSDEGAQAKRLRWEDHLEMEWEAPMPSVLAVAHWLAQMGHHTKVGEVAVEEGCKLCIAVAKVPREQKDRRRRRRQQ